MTAENIDQETASEHWLAAWQEDHNLQVEEWNAQQQAKAQDAECHEEEHQRRAKEAQHQANEQTENDHREAEKKPKMNNFTSSLPPPNVLEERPSQYTLTKLASFKFIPLWYFTLEGCCDAAAFLRSEVDNAYGLTSTNGVLTLKLVALVKASK
ncbi:hypothetical protein BS17DRAFT_860060, partial [Gyrodon lividus]